MNTINNVLIVVVDALRWDHLPDNIKERGVVFKTVAASTYTPPSFFSLFTGLYPPQHGVTGWGKTLPDNIPTFYDIDDLHSSVQGSTQSYGAFGDSLNNAPETTDFHPPFIEVHRAGSTHAPYPHSGSMNSNEYFASRAGDLSQLQAEYKKGADKSVNFLEARINELKQRDLLNETLIIYTSDHGELLGEHGEFDHSAPMCPELVYVPTVFIHPKISTDSFSVDPKTSFIEHVDITQTALDVIGFGEAMETMGKNVFTSSKIKEYGFSTVQIQHRGKEVYGADGLWNRDGGVVVQTTSRSRRIAYLVYQVLYGNAKHQIRRNIIRSLRTYTINGQSYDSVDIDISIAKQIIEEKYNSFNLVDGKQADLSETAEQRLYELGYRT